jgi:hypothetical protein
MVHSGYRWGQIKRSNGAKCEYRTQAIDATAFVPAGKVPTPAAIIVAPDPGAFSMKLIASQDPEGNHHIWDPAQLLPSTIAGHFEQLALRRNLTDLAREKRIP